MSAQSRQSTLFAGETWQVLYQAFTQINFNASDPASINAAMRYYIQTNYPEDFNDWIESSEFVAIVDLLAWLAGNLAFKTDLSVRENFIEVAGAKESILRLARFLSYNPSRNQPATGILKLIEVTTNDDVLDSFGNNLANKTVLWNDPDNANWYDSFTALLNNAFIATNPFGIPLKTGNVGGVTTQLYRLNGLVATAKLNFAATVSGQTMPFEICNADFTDGGDLFERPPTSGSALHMYNLSDGNGNASPRTGFFLLFKQGSTQTSTTVISAPIENQIIDINSDGINQNDVWVQTVDDYANTLTTWTKVPAILNSNITYNNIPVSQRNIFSVITRDNDQVSIRFSDGLFGNAPTGNLQVTYRVSNGLLYQIKPLDIDRVQIPFTYFNSNGISKTIYLTFSLMETINNAAPTETIEQIRQRAPMVYATQNRMVSGEDYNTFPLSANLASKIKAVNRVYSGHSRYIDINDPTGTYRDLTIIGEDGTLFAEEFNSYVEIPSSLNRAAGDIVNYNIEPLLRNPEVVNIVQEILLRSQRDGGFTVPQGMIWTQASDTPNSLSGTLSLDFSLIQVGCMLQMVERNSLPFWVGVAGISGSISSKPSDNSSGNVTLSLAVASGALIVGILPRYNSTLPQIAIDTAVSNLNLKLGFTVWYDYLANSGAGQLVIGPAPHQTSTIPMTLVDSANQVVVNATTSKFLLMGIEYVPSLFRITLRGTRYVFESAQAVEWYDDGRRAIDQQTGNAGTDLVKILRVNEDRNNINGIALKRDFNTAIQRLYVYPDGTAEPRRIIVQNADVNLDGFPDDPDFLFKVAPLDRRAHYLFWVTNGNDPFAIPCNTVWVFETEYARMIITETNVPNGTEAFQIVGVNSVDDNSFWTFTNGDWQRDFSLTYSYGRGRGSNVAARWMDSYGQPTYPFGDQIMFNWKHYAPSDHRIDPAPTNLHDVFVLTYEYDNAVRQWIRNGGDVTTIPLPPSELSLRLAFGSLENFRMFSDGIIWRPVRYKFLFGNSAAPEMQAQFKIVRLTNTTVSDGEIKTSVVNAINKYFEVSNWDFGDTFYYTELAAYIHQQLVGVIGSIVIVPLLGASSFGDAFEVSSRPDEIFISTAQVSDIVLIASNTPSNLRIR